MKEKYADQDEEEREMRLQLIGAKKVKGHEQILKKQDKNAGGKGGNNKQGNQQKQKGK